MLLVQLGINSTRDVWKFAKLDSTFEGGGGGGDLLLAGNFFSGIVMTYVQDIFFIPSPCTIFFCHTFFRSIFFSIAYTI